MRKSGKILVSLLTLLFLATGVEALADNARPAYKEGEVIVKYKDDAVRTLGVMDTIYKRAKVLQLNRFHGELRNFEHMVVETTGQSVESVIADLQRDPSVEYAQPNYLLYAEDFRPDLSQPVLPGKGNRPGVGPRPGDGPAAADPALGSAWGISKIGATKAWSKVSGSRDVLVAVIDTGVDYTHPDLAANIWRNPNFGRTRATGVDAEGKTAITGDLVGWDFVHNDNLPYDDFGHGTHVSGTIGAVGNNGIGVSGVNQKVSIMAVKFLGSNGSGDTAAAIRGIDYAVSRGAKVLNNSWGGKGGDNSALRDAVQRAANAGVLFVASAGNDGTNDDSDPSYPASFNLPNMITVAATTSNDTLASFSNTGVRTVHMGAPGVQIYSTLPGGKYGSMSGTSMASPHVTGAAALLWAEHPGWTAAQVKQRLLESGDPLPSLRGRTMTGRRLNVLRAIQ